MSLVKENVVNNPVVAPANRLKDKVAVISGGTRGIGLAVAKAYVREGAKVVIASRSGAELKTALAELKDLGGDATATQVDLNSEDSCRMFINGALRQYAKIDILVNNAGILGPRTPILQYTTKDWDNVMRTNLDVVFWNTRAALGTMIPCNQGTIINVTSGVGTKGRAGWGAYAVSKAGVINLTEVVSEEVSKYNIRVNCINPGPTRTMMREEAFPQEDPNTLPKPEDIVNPFIYLASDVSRGVTGMVLESRDWVGRSF